MPEQGRKHHEGAKTEPNKDNLARREGMDQVFRQAVKDGKEKTRLQHDDDPIVEKKGGHGFYPLR